jgi:SAM-dependent methyltransferase
MKKNQLQQLCKDNNIVFKKSDVKSVLIEKIQCDNKIQGNEITVSDSLLDGENTKYTILTSSYDILKHHYDNILNLDKSTYKSSNDEPTPIGCIEDMIKKIPDELWKRKNLKILDPCCGNGNFELPIYYKLNQIYSSNEILENIIHFNDLNIDRLNNVKKIYGEKLNLTNKDFLKFDEKKLYDLIVANPPYAKILANGKRASKNHNLIKDFIDKSLSLLKPKGYLLFITPDNWMSYADRNTLIEKITKLQIIHLDIHSAKKYFKKIGSSFTWYIIQNEPFYKNINISGIWNKTEYTDSVISGSRKYIPMLYNSIVQSILNKTVDNDKIEKFKILTSSDLHHYTKKTFIKNELDNIFKYKLIHTPTQIVYASRPHKFQDGYKVFISTTNKYSIFIDNCGMTQSIAFIICDNKEQAEKYKKILEHPLYIFINNICRWGNFNSIRILQSFPKPVIDINNETELYKHFNISPEEIKFINQSL